MYEIIKSILVILWLVFMFLALFHFVRWVASIFSKEESKGKSRQKYALMTVVCFLLGGACLFGSFAMAVKQYQFRMSELSNFSVYSDSLENGQWKDVITNTARGENKTPALSWESVSGAEKYAVVMIDEDAAWLHWLALDIEQSNLEEGQKFASSYSEYVGPYPPSGTHTYTIYVFALKKACNHPAVDVDSGGQSIEKIAIDLNTTPQTDDIHNIISYGKISGTYTHQD